MTTRRVLAVLALLVSALSAVVAQSRPAIAGPGDLDPSFNGGRPVIDGTPPLGYDAVATQRDGKIVVAGRAWRNGRMDVLVARYTSTGAPDASFGSGGRTLSDFGADEYALTVVVQPDGMIVVGGTQTENYNDGNNEGLVARYKADGTLDTAFGTGGHVVVFPGAWSFRVTSVYVQSDGRLLVAGHGSMASVAKVVRLHTDGSVDRSFNDGNVGLEPGGARLPVSMHVAGITVLPDGKVLVAGSTTYEDQQRGAIIVRLTAGGPVDRTYGDYGVARTRMGDGGFANDVAFQPDGKVVFAGVPVQSLDHQRFIVVRLGDDGRPDLTFGTGGELRVPVGDAQNTTAMSVALADDGSIFVAGWASAGPGGQPYVPSRQFVAHIQRTGAVDPRFGLAGIAATVIVGGEPNAAIVALAVQPDGRPVAVGGTADPVTTATRGFIFRLQPGYAGGPVTGCGWNGWGQLGEAIGVLARPAVGLRARTDVDGVVAGAYHSLSLDPDGRVWAAGWNAFGQLGDGTTTDRTTPVPVTGLVGVIAVSAGAYHSLAVKADGSVWAWGWNGFGQLGDGTIREQHAPVRVTGVSGVKVSAGAFHSMALGAEGGVEAWGYNGLGQLGDRTTVDRHRPVPVADLAGAVGISAGLYHSLALGDDGTVRSWGWNKFGQLGDGTVTDRLRPVAVAGLPRIATLGTGAWFHSLAVALDGSAWAWGWNGFGQLGDGTTAERHLPVRVAGTAVFQSVTGGAFHSAGVDLAGTVRAWGWNGLGQLCDGTTVDHHVPAPVRLPAGAAVSVAAGAFYSMAG